MANLDITEKRLPQDGRIKIEAANQRVDIRVSTLPTYYGEKIVLRILETGDLIESIENLGFGKRNSKLYRKLISNSYGIVLVTGPTGSGKTTTLYSGLSELNNDDVNIITVEDPVEIELEGINQVQVNEKVGLTFGNGLRSILRQDPDIVMVGEIRDLETADIAIKASLTGHLVFSTLHTNDALSTIYRLYDMSVKPYLISASIKGIMAQRLVRTLCPHCGYDDDFNELEQEVFSRYKIPNTKVRRAKGCSKCNNGYLGRTVIVEILQIDEHLQNLIVNQVSITELKRYAYSHGFVSMFRDGLGKVLAGRTTLKELLKVVNYE
jgi:type IV pilus assembly protein PilB